MRWLSLALLLALVGCGGGTSNNGSPETRTAHVTVRWSARSRVFSPPPSARSGRLVLRAASASRGDVALIVVRSSAPAGYDETYTFPEPVTVGDHALEATFYGDEFVATPIVARGSATVALALDGTLPDVALSGEVATVSVEAGQTAILGEPTALRVQVRDSAGTILVLSEGSFFWELGAGSAFLRFENGLAVGLAPGAASVVARVDGVSSASQAIEVRTRLSVTLTPASVTVGPGTVGTFTASVSGAGAPSGVVWSIVEGAAGGTIDSAGRYTAPGATGTYHVRATSVFDPSRFGDATVTVALGTIRVGAGFPETGGVDVGVR